MNIRAMAATGLLTLLTGCAAAAPAAVVTRSGTADQVGCRGWYAVAGKTLYAHLVFYGEVNAATVSAALADGTSFAPTAPFAVRSGVSGETVPVGPLSAGVVGATASVRGAGGRQGGCLLANPH